MLSNFGKAFLKHANRTERRNKTMNNGPEKFTIRLTMLSDWHIGTGAGRPGSVDKLLARDADGFPFVPAKTVNGIWRDALETLTFGSDGGAEGSWSKWVEAIFGIQPNQLQGVQPNETQAHELRRRVASGKDTYSFSLLSMQPARISQALRAKIDEKVNSIDEKERERQRQKILSALTFIKPGVAIDEKSGTAINDFLRFEEMGRAGTVLEAKCSVENLNGASDEQKQAIWHLLLVSAKLVERIGGKRRRGAGLCELKVCDEKGKEIDTSAALAWLENHKNAPDIPTRSNSSQAYSLNKEAKDGEWQTLEFSLHLRTPASIVTATLGNVSEALDFIPGTYLLPHVTRVLRAKLGDKIFQHVAYGDLQILPSTFEVNGQRGRPVPNAIYYDKVGGGFGKAKNGKTTVYNLLREKEEIRRGEQKKNYRGGYISSLDENGKKLPSYKDKNSSKTVLTHNTVEDRFQRPTTDVGGVYSRQAIAAGTTLRGEIRLRKSLSDELDGRDANWRQTLGGRVRLGTSRKDDYGSAELSLSPPKAFASMAKLNENRLTVYLSSDCLLRNSNLRQTNLVADLASELSKRLSQELPEEANLRMRLKPIEQNDKETTSLITTRRIESWHEGWGFPRPTLTALEAGSCAVFEIETFDSLNGEQRTALNDVQRNALEKSLRGVEAAGIGERRGEGYGQVRFNPPLLTAKINGWEAANKSGVAPKHTNKSNGGLSDEEKKFAMLIEETAWREELKIAVLKFADDYRNRRKVFGFEIEVDNKSREKRGIPQMSQIGGLRSAIIRLQEESDRALVCDWLRHLKDTTNRLERWNRNKNTKRARIRINRIMVLLRNDKWVWHFLRSHFNPPPSLERSAESLKKEFWAEAVRSLFGASARAHKRELEKKGEN
jgi:CRISPR-associated protein Csx10